MSDKTEAQQTILFIVVVLLFGSFLLGFGRENGDDDSTIEDVILLG